MRDAAAVQVAQGYPGCDPGQTGGLQHGEKMLGPEPRNQSHAFHIGKDM